MQVSLEIMRLKSDRQRVWSLNLQVRTWLYMSFSIAVRTYGHPVPRSTRLMHRPRSLAQSIHEQVFLSCPSFLALPAVIRPLCASASTSQQILLQVPCFVLSLH